MTAKELIQNYILTPGIYVGSEDKKDDWVPFNKKLANFKTLLKKQFEK